MKGHFTKRGCTCNPKQCTCDKTWSFVIPAGKDTKTGKRKQATKAGFKTEHDAQVAAAALFTEINQGTYIKESDILFRDFADEWLHAYTERNAPQPGTIRLRKYSINKLLNYFDHMKLKDITMEMYQVALDDLKDLDFSKSTIEGVHTTGKMIFKLAMDKRIIKLNVTESAYIKRDPRTIIEFDEDELPIYFEKEELALFLDTVKEKGLFMDTLIFHTLAYTGIRVGELVALKWKDINFEKQMISITKTYCNPKNNTKKYELGPPKTK
ncbi:MULTISPECIES: site-specific integrase [Sporosarcina]|uniref:site-specific integrase n=1 Tax=Sporosarcina TaxID=1569 RepID=UPI0030CFA92C